MATEMDVFKIVVFVLHFFFFGLTALLFLLKFHKKGKRRFVIYSAGILWIIFGSIAFVLELKSILPMFQ